MKYKEIEIKSAENINEYGVKLVNRLIEEQLIFSNTDKVHSKEYRWEADIIQPNGKKFTHQVAHYKQYAAMQRAMNKYHFETP